MRYDFTTESNRVMKYGMLHICNIGLQSVKYIFIINFTYAIFYLFALQFSNMCLERVESVLISAFFFHLLYASFSFIRVSYIRVGLYLLYSRLE